MTATILAFPKKAPPRDDDGLSEMMAELCRFITEDRARKRAARGKSNEIAVGVDADSAAIARKEV